MKFTVVHVFLVLLFGVVQPSTGQQPALVEEVENAMLDATRYMVEEVSVKGGYVWNYLPDFSRRWGEMEAYETMIWLQNPGTISMGHVFLSAYLATGNEYYYDAAKKAAMAIILGQSKEGGWNYMVDFGGDSSLIRWYQTIGKNGWRLEEFQHYYGNSTFDDDVTSDAARFLLRIYLIEKDSVFKKPMDKAIHFILKSQYPIGGWPQRYPLRYDFKKNGLPDYTSYHTFNDDVIWENIHFLMQCYVALGDKLFLDPIQRGMEFYILSQDSCGGWGQQVNMDLKAAGARTYEPEALLPSTSFGNAMLLLRFYRYTGDKKFLEPVPKTIRWLEETRLPGGRIHDGRYSHSAFVEPGTNTPVYVHRKGSNATHGYYYHDDQDKNLLAHYGGKTRIPVDILKNEYEKMAAMPPKEAIKDSSFLVKAIIDEEMQDNLRDLNRIRNAEIPKDDKVREIIGSLDESRWLIRHAATSNPYAGDGRKEALTDEYAGTFVGDETDTSPYRDESDQEYLSTSEYIRNMSMLINYINTQRPGCHRISGSMK